VDFSKTPAAIPHCTPGVELTLAARELQLYHYFSLFRKLAQIPERHTRISKRINYCWAGEEPRSGLSRPMAILRWDHRVSIPYGWGRYLMPKSYITYTYSIQTKTSRMSLQRVSRFPPVLRCDIRPIERPAIYHSFIPSIILRQGFRRESD
jgi:hypothetical protein